MVVFFHSTTMQKSLGLFCSFFKGSHLKAQQSWTETLQFIHGYTPMGLGKLGLWFPFFLSHFPMGDASIHNHNHLPAASPPASAGAP